MRQNNARRRDASKVSRSNKFAVFGGNARCARRFLQSVGSTWAERLILSVVVKDSPSFEIEHLFGNPRIMAAGLATTGLLILYSARRGQQEGTELSARSAVWIGAVQGLCLPFRGLSRSGATISTGLALGVARRRAEEFSFALAVVLTPAVIVKEAYRLYTAPAAINALHAGGSGRCSCPAWSAWSSASRQACWRCAGCRAGWSKVAGISSASIAWRLHCWCS